jgi:hypothetical protein
MAKRDQACSVVGGERRRERGGRYAVEQRCDACCKPITTATGGHFTDIEVCGGGDGPGFFLCGRERCCKRRNVDIDDRRAMYTAGRILNDAASKKGKR